MDDAALLTLAATQHGLATDGQAHDLGFSARTVRRRLESGEWTRPLPRVLRCAGAPDSGRQAAMAAALWAGDESVVSHATAGVLWALDGIATRRVEITVMGKRGLRSKLVTVHRSVNDLAAHRCDIAGIAVTTPTRTLLDLAGPLSMHALELAMEDAFRRGLSSPEQLERLFADVERERRAGASRLRVLLETRSERANTGSGGEVLLERLLRRAGLPAPTRQHPVVHEGHRIYVDFAYPEQRLAIEFDSLRWHTGRAKLDNDADRRNLLRAAKWDLVTVTYSMVKHRAAQTASLIRDAYADCCAKTVV